MQKSKTLLSVIVVGVGLAGMLVAPASQASWWHRWWGGNNWHTRIVRYRGCRRIVINRYCHINRWGYRQCRRVRRVNYVCY